jgi:hypothetical protein
VDTSELPIPTSPPAAVCAALTHAYDGGFVFAMGCPPLPPPVPEPRPCALMRDGERVDLEWNAERRLTRAGDLRLTYREDGQLQGTDRQITADETLETEVVSASAELVVWRVMLRMMTENEEVEVRAQAEWRFTLEQGVLTRLEITRLLDEPVVASDLRIRRSPGRIESEDAVTGQRTVTELDREGRVLSHTVTPADDPEIDDELEQPARQSFEWEGDRWTLFVDSGARVPVEYECGE